MMIEVSVIQYLSLVLDNVPVYAERPDVRSYPYVLVQKTGARRSNYVTTSTFAVQSCDSTLENAMTLNERVKEAMDGITELSIVGGIRRGSDYNFTNSSTKEYRYQAIFDITHY